MISDENRNIFHMQKEHETFTLVRLQIAEGKPAQAFSILENGKADIVENGRVRSQIESLILEALTYYANSNMAKAVGVLREVLSLGQAKGIRRLFLDEGARMAALLQATIPLLPSRTLSLFATTLLHSFSAEATVSIMATSSSVQVESLSQQELRVLRLLVAGLSNADIARELVVSNNTIKTHVKSIYRKLNVKSRQEAREMARELKLL